MLLMWYYSCSGIICAAQLWHEQWYSNSAMPGAKHPQAAPCRVLDVLYSLHGKFNIKILKLKPLRMSSVKTGIMQYLNFIGSTSRESGGFFERSRLMFCC